MKFSALPSAASVPLSATPGPHDSAGVEGVGVKESLLLDVGLALGAVDALAAAELVAAPLELPDSLQVEVRVALTEMVRVGVKAALALMLTVGDRVDTRDAV